MVKVKLGVIIVVARVNIGAIIVVALELCQTIKVVKPGHVILVVALELAIARNAIGLVGCVALVVEEMAIKPVINAVVGRF